MMNAIVTTTTLALLVGLGSVPPSGQQRQPSPVPQEPGGTVALDGARADLPMNLDTRRPMIEMLIDGHGPYWFIIDTGASSAVIDSGVAKELGLSVVGVQRVRSPNGPAMESAQYRIETLVSGGLQVDDVRMVGIDLATMSAGTFQGVLGIGVFRDYLLTFDYAASRLVVESGTLAAGEPGTVAFRQAGPAIGFDIEVAGVTIPAHLDTGSPGGFMLPKAFEDRWTFASPPVEGPPARLVGAEHPTWRARLDGTITVAGIAFSDPEIGLSDFTSDFANLGYEILRDMALTIDQRKGLARLTRHATGGAPIGR